MAFQSPREDPRKENWKTACLFSGGQFKYSMGVILFIFGKGVIVWRAFLGAKSRLRQLPAQVVWDGTSRLFEYMDASGWG